MFVVWLHPGQNHKGSTERRIKDLGLQPVCFLCTCKDEDMCMDLDCTKRAGGCKDQGSSWCTPWSYRNSTIYLFLTCILHMLFHPPAEQCAENKPRLCYYSHSGLAPYKAVGQPLLSVHLERSRHAHGSGLQKQGESLLTKCYQG